MIVGVDMGDNVLQESYEVKLLLNASINWSIDVNVPWIARMQTNLFAVLGSRPSLRHITLAMLMC